MKILYVISVFNEGSGGHYHSLDHISRAVAEVEDVFIISIGKKESSTLSSSPYYRGNMLFNGYNLIGLFKQLNYLLTKINPDIIHFFDAYSYSIVTLNPLYRRWPMLLTKCGGKNEIHYPKANVLTLFSKENLDYFLCQRKFKDAYMCLIPNRVRPLLFSQEMMPNIFTHDSSSFVFMRIARIGPSKHKSILDSIRLIENLRRSSAGVNVCLVVVGYIEDSNVFNLLMKEVASESLPVTFITDEKITKRGSDCLIAADAVIGTGRGVMEASSLSLPILCPANNSNIPILLKNEKMMHDFFNANFSGRVNVDSATLNNNILEIHKMISDLDHRKKLSDLSEMFFRNYFDLSCARDKYCLVYNDAIKINFNNFGDLFNKARYYLRCVRLMQPPLLKP